MRCWGLGGREGGTPYDDSLPLTVKRGQTTQKQKTPTTNANPFFIFYSFSFSGGGQPHPFLSLLSWRFVCGSGFALRLRRPQKLGRPGISEGPEKEGEEGPDEKSAVRILPAATARKYIECILIATMLCTCLVVLIYLDPR